MKKRYYLSMLSLLPLVIMFDVIYFVSHKSLRMLLMMGIPHIIVFGFVNLIGIYFLYKPIDIFFLTGKNTPETQKRVNRITLCSTAWMFIIGVVSFIVLLISVFVFDIAKDQVSLEKMPRLFFLSIISSSTFIWAIIPSTITYFQINDFALDLKLTVFQKFQILFPVGKNRIGRSLLSVFIILGIFPTLLLILELVIVQTVTPETYAEFMHGTHEDSLLWDQFITLTGFIFAIIFIPRSFTKPIYSLLKEFDKVGKGDYSTRAAIISSDEIGNLTREFNEMVYQLESSHNKQEEYSHNLEKSLERLNQEVFEREAAQKLAKQHQDRLYQSEKMASVGTLVSGVAHEINNPNNFILLNSDNLADVWKDLIPLLDMHQEENGDFDIAGLPYSEIREEISMIINGIKEGSLRIKNIVQTLKDFARKDPGNLDQEVDIINVIEDSETILTNLIKKSTDRFSISIADNIPKITGNIQQIEQVVINLISNACHSLKDRSKAISVSSNFDNKFLSIIVKDEGVGISPENLKYVMDPFFTTKRDTGGTGLGLSISYTIIKEHSGELHIKSEVGKGTIATIKLPI